jgi:hypothetical protein
VVAAKACNDAVDNNWNVQKSGHVRGSEMQPKVANLEYLWLHDMIKPPKWMV